MTRFALLTVLAALPLAVVAAPVPEPAPKPFGTDGIVSRAELEALQFDSRAVPDAERAGARARHTAERKVQAREGDDGPPKVRPANRFDVAVHMPATRFFVGEPVVAYFVVRNNRAEELELDGRLDTVDGVLSESGDCEVRLADPRTGEPGLRKRVQVLERSRASFLLIPADGFSCTKGDFGPLPAGAYELDWRCEEFRSAPVRFRVFERDAPSPPPAVRALRTGHRFFHLADDTERDRAERADESNDPIRRFVAPDPVEADELAAALASGSGTDSTAFVPDVRAIPPRDRHVVVSVDWHTYRSGDRIAVTLRAAPPFRTVQFDEQPHLLLQVEAPEAGERARQLLGAVSKKLERIAHFVTPLTVEADLPAGWRELLGSGETARVAVLVTARELRLPRDGLQETARDTRAVRAPGVPDVARGGAQRFRGVAPACAGPVGAHSSGALPCSNGPAFGYSILDRPRSRV